MSTRLEWGQGSSISKEEVKEDDIMNMANKMNRMSFEPARHNIDQSTSFDRKVKGYEIRTISEPIYEDELVKNLMMEICYEGTNTNPNSICIPINIYLNGYNRRELRTCIDIGCFVWYEKNHYFP